MTFVQRTLTTLIVGIGLFGVVGCEDNAVKIPEGQVPPDAPKSSSDAYKNMGTMKPEGAKTGASKAAPPPAPN